MGLPSFPGAFADEIAPALPDSARADSTRLISTPTDSTRTDSTSVAPLAAAPVDTIRPPARPRPSWRQARAWEEAKGPQATWEIGSAALDASPQSQVRDVLEWSGPLRRVPSGSYNLPDPIDAGDLPGREPPGTVLEGLPLATPGSPEMLPDPVGPLWLSRLALRPPDPLRFPNNPGGGPLCELELVRPESIQAVSGARVISGTSGLYSEEFFLARPSGRNLVRLFYADHKTDGRELFGREFGENLLARLDRGASWGGWRLGWQQNLSRAALAGPRRLIWNRSVIDAGASGRAMGWSADLACGLTWQRFVWENPSAPATRKDALARALLRLRGPGGRMTPLLTLEFDGQRQRFDEAGVLSSLDRRHRGLGFAAGVEGASEGWRFRGSAGRSAPAPRRSGWTAAVEGEREIGRGWFLLGQGDRSVRAPLVPRLANELGTLVGQDLTVPTVDSNRRLEEILRVEFGLARRDQGQARLELRVRGVEIRHTLSAEGGLLRYFTPNGYRLLPSEAMDRTIRVASVRGSAQLPLPAGFRLECDLSGRVADPGWREELWMTPWDGRARFAWSGRLFKGDLGLEGFVRGTFCGRRAAPQSLLAPSQRADAGVTAQIGPVDLFFLLQNLGNDHGEAASYDGGWFLLPLRSYRMGLTWRFQD